MNVIALLMVLLRPPVFLIDFTSTEDIRDWYIVNDGVMGGLSKGNAVLGDEGVLFYGDVSLDNNGGFTSLRSPYRNLDLSSFTSVEIKYRSRGVRHSLQLEVDRRFYLPNYKVPLENTEGWEVKKVSLREIAQYRMGNKTGRLLEGDELSRIIRLGFITNEKKAGQFALEVAYIKFE